MLVDIGLKFYAVPSQPTGATLRSRSLVIDFDKFSGKAQVRRAMLSCDSSYSKAKSQVRYGPLVPCFVTNLNFCGY